MNRPGSRRATPAGGPGVSYTLFFLRAGRDVDLVDRSVRVSTVLGPGPRGILHAVVVPRARRRHQGERPRARRRALPRAGLPGDVDRRPARARRRPEGLLLLLLPEQGGARPRGARPLDRGDAGEAPLLARRRAGPAAA